MDRGSGGGWASLLAGSRLEVRVGAEKEGPVDGRRTLDSSPHPLCLGPASGRTLDLWRWRVEGGREWAPEPQAPALFCRGPTDQGLLRCGGCQEVPLCTAPPAEMETVGKRKHLLVPASNQPTP